MCAQMWFTQEMENGGRCSCAGLWDSRICRGQSRQAGACDAERRSLHQAECCVLPAESRWRQMNGTKSPCLTCTRVKNPADCENKNCRVWRAWFAESWDRARMNPRLQREKDRSGLEGVTICGRTYLLPDKVREYLKVSPCKTCPMPAELCTSPCPAYRTWQETRKEVAR